MILQSNHRTNPREINCLSISGYYPVNRL